MEDMNINLTAEIGNIDKIKGQINELKDSLQNIKLNLVIDDPDKNDEDKNNVTLESVIRKKIENTISAIDSINSYYDNGKTSRDLVLALKEYTIMYLRLKKYCITSAFYNKLVKTIDSIASDFQDKTTLSKNHVEIFYDLTWLKLELYNTKPE